MWDFTHSWEILPLSKDTIVATLPCLGQPGLSLSLWACALGSSLEPGYLPDFRLRPSPLPVSSPGLIREFERGSVFKFLTLSNSWSNFAQFQIFEIESENRYFDFVKH